MKTPREQDMPRQSKTGKKGAKKTRTARSKSEKKKPASPVKPKSANELPLLMASFHENRKPGGNSKPPGILPTASETSPALPGQVKQSLPMPGSAKKNEHKKLEGNLAKFFREGTVQPPQIPGGSNRLHLSSSIPYPANLSGLQHSPKSLDDHSTSRVVGSARDTTLLSLDAANNDKPKKLSVRKKRTIKSKSKQTEPDAAEIKKTGKEPKQASQKQSSKLKIKINRKKAAIAKTSPGINPEPVKPAKQASSKSASQTAPKTSVPSRESLPGVMGTDATDSIVTEPAASREPAPAKQNNAEDSVIRTDELQAEVKVLAKQDKAGPSEPQGSSKKEEAEKFLTPEEMLAKNMGSRLDAPAIPTVISHSQSSLFLSPEEMMARKFSRYQEEKWLPANLKAQTSSGYATPEEMMAIEERRWKNIHEKDTDRSPAYRVDRIIDDLMIPRVVRKRQTAPRPVETADLTPSEKPAAGDIRKKRRKRKRRAPKKITSDSGLTIEQLAITMKKARAEEPGKTRPGDDKTLQGQTCATPVLNKVPQLRLSELEDDFGNEAPVLSQLDLAPILKKKDIDSPREIMAPDEVMLEEEEEYVNRALVRGAIINDRFEVIKLLRETRDHNTYLARRTDQPDKELILKEIIPPDMPRDELKKRRDRFSDTIRILSSFKHPNLTVVHEGFSQSGRLYSYMDVVDGLDLYKLTRMNTKGFSEKEVIKWALQLCSAVEFMHFRPNPFTLGELHPRHLMISYNGQLELTGYDLQRFFDTSRTLEFMPDDPTSLYGDITKVARILYFLLTKTFWDDQAMEVAWPYPVGNKIKKLLETACAGGQRSFGNIKRFRERLEDTQVKDTQGESQKKIYRFPSTKISFKWLKKAWAALAGQRSYMKAIEIVFILFLFAFFIASRAVNPGYHRPWRKPLAYVATTSQLFTIDPSNMKVLDQRRLGFVTGAFKPITIKMPDPQKPEKFIDRRILLASVLTGRKLFMIDTDDNTLVTTRWTGTNPSHFIEDEKNRRLWVLHKTMPMALQFDSGKMKPERLVLLTDEPSHGIHVPGKIREYNFDKDEIRRRGGIRKFPPGKNQLRGFIFACTKSRKLVAVNPDTGKIIGCLKLDFTPGPMVLRKLAQELLVLDKEHNRIVPINLVRCRQEKPIYLTHRLKKPTDMVKAGDYGNVWISYGESNSLLVYNPVRKIVSDPIFSGGAAPCQMCYRSRTNHVWVLNRKTMNLSVFDAKNGHWIKDLKLGKIPVAICFDEGRPD